MISKKTKTPSSSALIEKTLHDKNLWKQGMKLPSKYEKHGDLILFPKDAFRDSSWQNCGDDIWQLICQHYKVSRVARKTGSIESNNFRSPKVELLYGNDPWAVKKENGITYRWNIFKCMFSSGNITEKQRIGSWNCLDQIVVDLFAGIGYFTLTYLIHSKAKHVYACEWNPDSVEALKMNLKLNHMDDNRCTVLFGDNRITAPKNVADHVNLGLLPSSRCSWLTACQCLRRDTGGILHIHENVDTMNVEKKQYFTNEYEGIISIAPDVSASSICDLWKNWALDCAKEIYSILENLDTNLKWIVCVSNIFKVKSYGPHIYHLVLDLRCSPSPLALS